MPAIITSVEIAAPPSTVRAKVNSPRLISLLSTY